MLRLADVRMSLIKGSRSRNFLPCEEVVKHDYLACISISQQEQTVEGDTELWVLIFLVKSK